MCSPHPELSSHLPPHPTPLGCTRAPALGALLHALNLLWLSNLDVIIYMFQCYSLKSSHLCLLPQVQNLFFTSVSLLLSHIQSYHYHLSKFHIYVLIYCVGVFLSDLLHSV